ncbi:MAG: hypothetical protein SNG27_07425 [Rikenellaceae bacterium]
MITKISKLFTLLLLFVVGLTSCSDDANDINYYGYVTLQKTGVFFENWGDTQTTTFTLDNVAYLEINQSNIEDWTGDTDEESWKVEIEFYKGLVTITAPTKEGLTQEGESNQLVEISLKGETHDGYSIYKTITVGVVPFVYIDADLDMQANSMIITEPGNFYIFNPSYKGEDRTQTLGVVDDCRLIWKDYSCSINHVQMISSTEVGFYADYDEYDADDDDIEDDIIEGNGVIAALNSSGDVVWSWHIWVIDEDPTDPSRTVSLNGKTWMDRNLGAKLNSIESDTVVLESYGLYYQWGRKDPFIQPILYNASGGYDDVMVDYQSSGVSITYDESDSDIGTVKYAIENPLTYIYAEEDGDSSYDWLYRTHDKTLWSDDTKSIYDPSPKGWRIPRSTDFVGLELDYFPPAGTYADASYGAYIKDSYGNSELFMGLGRRTYITGRISNVNTDYYSLAPWSAFYWTSGADDDSNKAICFRFDNASDDEAVLASGKDYFFETQHENQRANGMQIRCVKDE